MGTALEVFNDFMESTGPSYLRGPQDLINEAVKRSYLLGRFLKGRPYTDVLQGGSRIRDVIMFDEESTRQFYQPNDTFTWQNPQVLNRWETNWRFIIDHMSWTDHEVLLNTSGMGKSARHHEYKTLKYTKEMRLWTSYLNGSDTDLFRTPNYQEMELASGKMVQSLPVFINEDNNGLWGKGWASAPVGTYGTSGFTVQQIDPVVQTKWTNQVQTYDAAPTGANWTGFNAFDKLYLQVKFDRLPAKPQYSEAESSTGFWATSMRGMTMLQAAMRYSQDLFVSPDRQDPAYPNPKYHGIEVVYVSELDTAALYEPETGNVPAPENTALITGPRYYAIMPEYVTMVYHTERYMESAGVMRHPNQPFTWVMPVDTWCNLVARSRQRQGIITPSTDVVWT
jgi:hypothetical protein